MPTEEIDPEDRCRRCGATLQAHEELGENACGDFVPEEKDGGN